jgi:hypothetical protein
MRIRNTFVRGNRTFPQKDIHLNHCFRLGLANDDKTHHFYYLGDMALSFSWEDEVDESKKLELYSLFEKYLDDISGLSSPLEEIFLMSYRRMEVGYKVFADDLIILGVNEDELLVLVFCKQSRRSKTIYGAFKATQMNYYINRAQPWRLIYAY